MAKENSIIEMDRLVKNSSFLKRYIEKMVDRLSFLYPKKSKDEIKKIVENVMSEHSYDFEDDNNKVELYNNYTNETEEFTILDLFNYYYDEKPIMSGFGSMFQQHDVAENINGSFIKYLKDTRKIYKDMQFEGLEEKDEVKENKGKMTQTTMKLLNNSYYGVTGEHNSQFYNPMISPSVTYTGYSIITTSILSFEMILSDNVKYDNFNDLVSYISTVVSDRSKLKDSIKTHIDDISKIKRNDTYKRLKKLCSFKPSVEELDKLKDILKGFNKEQICNLYYTNNLFQFIIDSSEASNYLNTILSETIVDPAKASEEVKDAGKNLWELVKNYVMYDHQIYNRGERAREMKRNVIIVVDTDSNFICLDNYVNFIKDYYGMEISDDKNMFTVINSAVILFSHFIQKALDRFTSNCNLSEDKQPIINMKSE